MNDGNAALVVAAVLFEGRGRSEAAREYGVSRRWMVALVQRYLAEGGPVSNHAHEDRCTAPAAPARTSKMRSSRYEGTRARRA